MVGRFGSSFDLLDSLDWLDWIALLDTLDLLDWIALLNLLDWFCSSLCNFLLYDELIRIACLRFLTELLTRHRRGAFRDWGS